MLDVLRQVVRDLPRLLDDPGAWRSLHVTYHPPRVERLWRTYGDEEQYRILLHRIHPCDEGDALFHPHPWPSAVLVVEGEYEHCLAELAAQGAGHEPTHGDVLSRALLGPGSMYEMTQADAWHSVRPVDRPCDSVMVVGPLYDPPVDMPSPPSEKQEPLSRERFAELFAVWRQRFDWAEEQAENEAKGIDQTLLVRHDAMGEAMERWAADVELDRADEETQRVLRGVFSDGWSSCMHSTLTPARNMAMAILQLSALAQKSGDGFKVVLGGQALEMFQDLAHQIVGEPEQWQLDEVVDTVHVDIPDEGEKDEN